jgi:hypothetical protein
LLFEPTPGERVLVAEDATWLRSWWRRPRGRLYFTTQRLVFEQDIQTSGVAGIVAINEMRNRVIVDVGRDRLNSAALETHKRKLVLTVKTDDERLMFAHLRSPQHWLSVLQEAIEVDRTAVAELVARLEQNAAPGPSGDPYRGGGKK